MSTLWWLVPSSYLWQMVSLLVGCVVLGAGVSLEVKADVAMVAGEYLVQVISRFIGREFGVVKVFFDVALVLMACVISLVFMGHIEGVREGTFVSALIVGPISHFFFPRWRMLDSWLCCGMQGVASSVAAKHCIFLQTSPKIRSSLFFAIPTLMMPKNAASISTMRNRTTSKQEFVRPTVHASHTISIILVESEGDPHNYDLMVNTGAMSLETICTLVEHLYNERISIKSVSP